MSFAQCRLPDRTVSTLLSDKFKRDCSLEKTAPTTQSLWQEKGQSKAKEAKAKLEAWGMNWEKPCLQIQCIYIYIHTHIYICDNIQTVSSSVLVHPSQAGGVKRTRTIYCKGAVNYMHTSTGTPCGTEYITQSAAVTLTGKQTKHEFHRP